MAIFPGPPGKMAAKMERESRTTIVPSFKSF